MKPDFDQDVLVWVICLVLLCAVLMLVAAAVAVRLVWCIFNLPMRVVAWATR